MTEQEIIRIEDQHTPPFFQKLPLAIERGAGVYVWDVNGKQYLDFTAGWGVTSLGHASPVITDALIAQSRKIIQNPNSGAIYAPARAELLALLLTILPANLTRVFFASSGAEANDASIKLARKVTGRLEIVSTFQSFHGRTISTASATGQVKHRSRFNTLMPHYAFVPYNDLDALAEVMNADVAAVMLEPIQGEGGVNIPAAGYLEGVSDLCRQHGALLIIDEIQTGFCRTGSMLAIDGLDLQVDFLTMAKGLAGGFPFAAFAMSEAVSAKIEKGDHGGTYCGNPLGCAVAHAVVSYLIEHDIAAHVRAIGASMLQEMQQWQAAYPELISEVRGQGLLLACTLRDEAAAAAILKTALAAGLMVNVTQGKVLRLFPALTMTAAEAAEGLNILRQVIAQVANA